MSILSVDLTEQVIEEIEDTGESGYIQMKRFLDGNREGDALALFGFSGDTPSISGASSVLYAYWSPLYKKNVYAFTQSDFPFVLKSRGWSAIFLKGRARRLSYITIRGKDFLVRTCEKFRLSSFDEFAYAARDSERDTVISTGRAADVLAPQAALYVDGREVGMGGLGSAFSLLNLKGIVYEKVDIEREKSEENKKYLKRLSRVPFARTLRRESTSGLIKAIEKRAMLPTEGFARRRDARAIFLDGRYLKEKYGVYSTACTDCPVACRRETEDREPATDLFDNMALGSLLDIFSSDEVVSLKKDVKDAGIERYSAASIFLTLGSKTRADMKKALDEVWTDKKHFGVSWCSSGGMTPRVDPRGCGEEAIFLMTGNTNIPYWSIYAPVRIERNDVSAILALYEKLFTYALSSRSLAVNGAYTAYISPIPGFVYRMPWLLRLYLGNVKMFGVKAKTLIREGWEIMTALGEDDLPLDERFIYTVDPIEPSLCENVKLMDSYRREKLRLESKLFKKEKVRKAEKA